MSTPNPIVFPPLVRGFVWSISTTDTTGKPLPAGETESGSSIGIRADGDATHGPGNYSLIAVVPAGQASETPLGLYAALGKALTPGNYWGAVDQTEMLNGAPSTSAWSSEVPFSIPVPVPVIVKPAAPLNFSAA